MNIVNVVIVTYNQEKYIAQAIESALMQITGFPFTIILNDDCSVDLTSEICREYAEKYPSKIVYHRNIENLGLVRNYKIAFELCDAKYIAILEGDDFWIDEYKLQKQVDILESDNNIGLVHTNCNRLYEDGRIEKRHGNYTKNPLSGNIFDNLFETNFIASVTCCFRKEILDRHFDFNTIIENEFLTIDYPIWLEISMNSKIYYLNTTTAVYRILQQSISNNENFDKRIEFQRGIFKIRKYYSQKFNLSKNKIIEIEESFNKVCFKTAILMSDRKNAIEYASKLTSENLLYRLFVPILKSSFIFRLFCKLSQVYNRI